MFTKWKLLMKYLSSVSARVCPRPGLIGLLLCLVSIPAWSLERLHVKAGESKTLSGEQREYVFDELVLEDGATLLLDGADSRWHLEARRARIGKNTRIIGGGDPGADGANGKSVSGQAAVCKKA